ncbi:MAG: TIGR04133 family radical SAM/SPASM protein [Bacteroidales bacterium]|nr:TIGR04133 family radical SAM/SPASM protein [Bacteroidales bacterium]
MTGKRIGPVKKLRLGLFAKLQDQRIGEHRLRQLFWECTLRCNAACLHCGSDCRASSEIKDMPAADFLRVIDSLTPHVDPHSTFIILTGGEPLVRRDLEKVGRELYDREYPWGIVTNGILLDRRRFDSLLGSGIHTATVSLDGFSEDHTWMRGNPKAFDNASNAIRMMASEPGFIFDVVTCVNQRNLPSLEEFKEYLISLGVRDWRIFTIFPVGRARLYPELQLSDSQFTEVMDFIVRTRREGRIHLNYACEGFLGGYEEEVRDMPYHCDAGVSVASVLADGSISACPSIRSRFYQGNIYTDDFWEVWNTRFQMYRDRSWARTGQCAGCNMFRYCRGGGLHLHDHEGNLLLCHYNRLTK